MTFRNVREGDYEEMCSWREARGLLVPPESWVGGKVGGVVHSEEDNLCMGWCRFDEEIGFAEIDWLTTRPGLSLSESEIIIGHCLEGMEHCLKNLYEGAFSMIGWLESRAMAERASKQGFHYLGHMHMIQKVVPCSNSSPKTSP